MSSSTKPSLQNKSAIMTTLFGHCAINNVLTLPKVNYTILTTSNNQLWCIKYIPMSVEVGCTRTAIMTTTFMYLNTMNIFDSKSGHFEINTSISKNCKDIALSW